MGDDTLVSVGYEGRTIEPFIDLLLENEVTALVDVRLTPISRKPGFSKTALREALTGAGIEYVHEPKLGNPRDNRDGYRDGHQTARDRYRRILANGAAPAYESMMHRTRVGRVALMCFERVHDECHRAAIVERAQSDNSRLTILKL